MNDTTSNTYQFINLEYLDLMSDGDNGMKKILLEMLLDELPTEFEKMIACSDSKSWNDLSEVSHKMKSTLAYVGNDEMTVSNKTIEILSKTEQDLDQIPTLLASLKTNLDRVMPELKIELSRL